MAKLCPVINLEDSDDEILFLSSAPCSGVIPPEIEAAVLEFDPSAALAFEAQLQAANGFAIVDGPGSKDEQGPNHQDGIKMQGAETPACTGNQPNIPNQARPNAEIYPFGDKFFADLAESITQNFPYEQFAEEHGCTAGDVYDALLATVPSRGWGLHYRAMTEVNGTLLIEDPKKRSCEVKNDVGTQKEAEYAAAQDEDQNEHLNEHVGPLTSLLDTIPLQLEEVDTPSSDSTNLDEQMVEGVVEKVAPIQEFTKDEAPKTAPAKPCAPITPPHSKDRKRVREEDSVDLSFLKGNKYITSSAPHPFESPSPPKKPRTFYPEPKPFVNNARKLGPFDPFEFDDLEMLDPIEQWKRIFPRKEGRRRVYRDFAGSYIDVVPSSEPAITGYCGHFGDMLESGEIKIVPGPNGRRKFVLAKDMPQYQSTTDMDVEYEEETDMDSEESGDDEVMVDHFVDAGQDSDEDASVPDEFSYFSPSP
ncbi:predicted protein [Uncinocarpus reesii 1704]|uniref:Uncharacterized protein n=1 Tax=Uncinocarpus reesii (strain UAMH 1704) TaxID=336963 RepID=C4JNB0_UNCRE|nr:uncharacterized protein UREG_04316 [Uncinocarpus reesii 1704]EEP79470.1 predicted protein [Uncinocarpus reesii 1704]